MLLGCIHDQKLFRHRAVQEEERGEVIVENDIGKLPLVLNAEFRINISRNSNIDSEDNLAIPLADTHVGLTPVTQSTLTRPVLDGDILTPASIPSPALSIPKRKFSSDNGRKILEMNVKKVMEMFPRVDVDWIRHEVQKSEAVLERVIQYILDNEHTDKVPKQSRKRPFEIAMSTARRASILVQNDNTKTVRLQREDCPPGMHSIINKIALMSQEEKLMHCAMVDALFNRLVEPSKDVILRVDKTSEDSIIIRYPMVRQIYHIRIFDWFLNIMYYTIDLKIILVLEQDVLKGRNSRPLTKNPNISQTRRDTERSHPFANRSFQRAWKAVQNIINANYRDKVEMFHCKVCFDDFIILTAICCRSANEKSDIHKFCAGCVTGMAKASTGVGLTCLEAGCEGHIAWGFVQTTGSFTLANVVMRCRRKQRKSGRNFLHKTLNICLIKTNPCLRILWVCMWYLRLPCILRKSDILTYYIKFCSLVKYLL
uniref:CUE domain-containing protein n=1 Tax=Heterorhabditis bacteriophora TaxID=37862 RepID=A0A1I7W9T3_HETBA